MRGFLLASLGLILISVTHTAKSQTDLSSANASLEHCRNSAYESNNNNMYSQGLCSGKIQGISWALDQIDFCIPPGVTNGQQTKVVISFLDRVPHRLHENFMVLVVQAFKTVWPCARR